MQVTIVIDKVHVGRTDATSKKIVGRGLYTFVVNNSLWLEISPRNVQPRPYVGSSDPKFIFFHA